MPQPDVIGTHGPGHLYPAGPPAAELVTFAADHGDIVIRTDTGELATPARGAAVVFEASSSGGCPARCSYGECIAARKLPPGIPGTKVRDLRHLSL